MSGRRRPRERIRGPGVRRTGLEHGRAPTSLAHRGRVRVRGRTVPLPSQLHAPGTGDRSQVVPRVRRRLLLRRRVVRRRLPRRHRGLLRPARVRSHRSAPTGSRSRARARGRLPAAARPHRETDRDRPVRTLGRGRSRVQPGWTVAADADRRDGTGPHRQPARPVHRSARRARAASPARSPSTPTARSMPSCARTSSTTRARRCSMRSVRSRSRVARTGSRGRLTVDDAPRWWPRSLGAQPRCTLSLSVSIADEHERRTDRAHRVSRRTGRRLEVLDQRGATVPQGRQPRADAHGARPTQPSRRSGATSCSRRKRTWTSCACTRTSPGRSSTTPPTSSACSCGRTCRCSGATHAAYAARPSRQARRDGRPARSPPERVPVVRAQRAVRGRPRTGRTVVARRAAEVRGNTRAPHVGQGSARPLRRARPRPARQHPAGRAPQRRAARDRRAGHRRAPLPRLVPRRSRWARRERPALAPPRSVRLRVRRAGRSRDRRMDGARTLARPRLGHVGAPSRVPTRRLRAADAARRREVVRRVARA